MPARAHRRDLDVPVLVLVLVAHDVDLQPRLGEPLGQPLAPLDDGDGLVERGVEVEVVELGDAAEPVGVDVDQAGPPTSLGCTRAMTKVGEVTAPRTPRPAPSPWVNVVLPAPSEPVSTIRSPGASWPATERPRPRIASASGAWKTAVRSGRRSSTFGGSRRISWNPCRSQNRIVAGSSSRATTVRSS